VPWGVDRPERVVWRVEREPSLRTPCWPRALEELLAAHDPRDASVREALASYARGMEARPAGDWPSALYDARSGVLAAARVDALAQRGAQVAGAGVAVPQEFVGATFADVANPFDPLLELWAQGYSLASFSHRAAVLVAPEV
jgi:hypothetical protein